MNRLGQSSPQAALRYQHATKERDRKIAEALSELAAAAEADVPRTTADDGGCAIDVRWTTSDQELPQARTGLEQEKRGGAGDGNRTRVLSLGSMSAPDVSSGEHRNALFNARFFCPLVTARDPSRQLVRSRSGHAREGYSYGCTAVRGR
jgi:hypothetical protein